MKEMLTIPTEDLMKIASEVALRQAIETISGQLLRYSEDPRLKNVNGQQALLAAVEAIKTTNTKYFG